ncbi:MAG: anthranilate phosphoribosyltransferase [Spirochaetales bacterium]|nr:anthranilate phosphoribosyltransferase [Spirochaetales bacterium]
MIKEKIHKIKSGLSLGVEEARATVLSLLDDEHSDETIAELLCALADKGETVDEITGFARGLLEKVVPLDLPDRSIDLCGTGGGKRDRFNISTVVSFVLAAGGVPVVKHGNKGSKKPNGSFDLLEELAIPYNQSPDRIKTIFNKSKLCFVFARAFHPAMKKVVKARQIAARRTIFNLIGPLCNPAQPKYQIIGSVQVKTSQLLARALYKLGRTKCLVITGEPGIDEISISGKTRIVELTGSKLKEYNITPSDFGIKPVPYETIPAGDCKENAKYFKSLMQSGEPESLLDMVSLNAGAAFYCFGKTASIKEGYELSKKLFSEKRVTAKFNGYKSLPELNQP